MKKFYRIIAGLSLLFYGGTGFAQITTYDYTGSLQAFTVPMDVTNIRITAIGAQGGNDGGFGASMSGEFSVVPGEVLTILVGEQGTISGTTRAGGGGGSFVVNDADEPMIIAGGGGGRAWDLSGEPTFPGIDANTGEAGSDGYSAENGLGGSFTLRHGLGGVGGNGSTLIGPHGNAHAGNGGGFYTGGLNGDCGTAGSSFLSGAAGGVGCIGGLGGYGGGGGGGNSGGGGGGGYSGGGGSYHNPTNGGGGGSYNSGIDQDNSVGNTGNGQVIIEVLCSAITVTVSDDAICLGDSFTLEGSGLGTITWDGGVENGVPYTPATAGIFTYTASSDDGGDCGYSLDIEVLALPTVVATADESEICFGESVTLFGSGADTYSWDMGVIDGAAFEPGVGTEIYTVTGTDAGTGCENTDEIEVVVNDLPTVTANATDNEICLGESLTLTGSGATAYVWTPA